MPRHCGGSALYEGIWGLAAPTPRRMNGDSHMEGIVRHYGTGAIAYEYGTSTLVRVRAIVVSSKSWLCLSFSGGLLRSGLELTLSL